jgi:hypothetical protein
MAFFNLIIQRPEVKDLGGGKLYINEKNGAADFFDGNAGANARVIASMARAKIEWAAADGIFLSGMEADGIDKQGRQKFKLQEWLLRYSASY